MTYLFLACLTLVLLGKILSFFSPSNEAVKLNQERITCGTGKGNKNELKEQLNSVGPDKFIVAVVGDGVNDKTMAQTRPYSSNYAQGWDLYEGVAHAATKRPYTDVSQNLEIVYIDDGGDGRCAKLISEEIIKSPNVIGVIGHATSSTTRIALNAYRKANIPLIMPIATNPSLTFNCKNCFRLPSNDSIQAIAIADYAVNHLHGKQIYLIWDASESAKDYSDYLQSAVTDLIGDKIKFQQKIEFKPMNYQHLLQSISLNETDVVIFCGYGSLAREFFNGLRFEYLGKDREAILKRPKVILSDGSKISDIKDVAKFGFDAYLSFPSEKWSGKKQFADYNAENPPQGREKMKAEQSYEIFGNDALTLFSLAFAKAKGEGRISRKTLNENMSEIFNDDQLVYKYKFIGGENINSQYFIYKLGVDTDAVVQIYNTDLIPTLKKFGKVAIEEEQQFLDGFISRLQVDANARGLISLTTDINSTQTLTNSRVSRIFDYLSSKGIDKKRISFAIAQDKEEQTELWLIAPGTAPPALSGEYTSIEGEVLAEKSQPKIEATKSPEANK
jgi:hypothetical protein